MRIEHAATHDAQSSGPLGDEHGAVGQERNSPGLLERPRHHDEPKLPLLGGFELERPSRHFGRWPEDRGRRAITILLLRRERLLRLRFAGSCDRDNAEQHHE